MSEARTVQFKIWRGDANGGAFHNYTAECSEGMVVLDAVHQIQRTIWLVDGTARRASAGRARPK